MENILKIAHEIFAINFNKLMQKDRIILLNQINKDQIQYVIFILNKKYIVFKIKSYKDINHIYGLNVDEIINALTESDLKDIQNNIGLYDQHLQLNKNQLCDYFINNIGMEIEQFENYFKLQASKNKTFKYKNITISIYNNCVSTNDVKYCINEIRKIKYKDILKNLKINFVQKITEYDSCNIGGNTVNNVNDFDNVINLQNQNILKTLFHELGHIYQNKYLNKKQLNEIYEFVLDNQNKINIDDDYLFIEGETVPQLFCCYYEQNNINKFTKHFIQDKILK